MIDATPDPLRLVPAHCGACGSAEGTGIGAGYDYEYHSAPDLFHAWRCNSCGTVYLNPRPDLSEFKRIYPPTYHSLEFSPDNYSFVHRIRSHLEARRLLRYCQGIPTQARILDVGCGDGFHMRLLRDYGEPNWSLEGVDIDPRAVARATKDGLNVHEGSIETLDLPAGHYDVIYALQTIEHLADPGAFMTKAHRLLKPGGRLVLVTDNIQSIDFRLFRRSYWGGYHFPRHWNLFTAASLTGLAERTGFRTLKVCTIVSPVNWVYSIHNSLVGIGAPDWLIRRFTLKAPVALGVFTILDMALNIFGRGALLNAYFEKL